MSVSVTTTRKNGQKTKARLLHSTEKLFALEGVAGVTMRGIAKQANTNLASPHYHFGSKEAMVLEMLKSKIEPINRERKKRLQIAKNQFEGRDLQATIDFRSVCAACLEEVFNIDHDYISSEIFEEKNLQNISKHIFG